MPKTMKQIRNSAKVIIIQDGRLLCTRNRDELGDFYTFMRNGRGLPLRETATGLLCLTDEKR